MAITNEQEKKLEKLFNDSLQKQFSRGIRVGIQTCSKVCLEKLNNNSKPLMKRIEDLKKFCNVAMQSDFLTKDGENVNSTEDLSEHNSDKTDVSQTTNN